MQQPPPGQGWPQQMQPQLGYGQPPTSYVQSSSPYPPQQGQWAQQPYTPYPPQQGYPPQQPYAPQQEQWQQPFTPNPQWNHQPYGQPPQQQPQTPKPVNVVKSLAIVFGILAVIIVVILFLIIKSGSTGNTASSTLSEPDYKASTIDTTVATLDKDSNADKGNNVHFTATILNFVKDSNGNTAGANVDNTLTSGIVQVIFPNGTDLSKVNAGDTLEVWGVDEGSFSGTNAFGATIQEVGVGALYMTDQTTTYQTA